MEKEKSDKMAYNVGSVVTQTAPAVIESKTGNALTTEEAIAKILNELEYIRGKLG